MKFKINRLLFKMGDRSNKKNPFFKKLEISMETI